MLHIACRMHVPPRTYATYTEANTIGCRLFRKTYNISHHGLVACALCVVLENPIFTILFSTNFHLRELEKLKEQSRPLVAEVSWSPVQSRHGTIAVVEL